MVEVGNEFTWDLYRRGQVELAQAVDIMKKAGVTVYDLPEQERARWDQVLNDSRVAAKTIADCKAHGYPAEEVAKYYIKALEEEGYKFPYPPEIYLKK